MYIYSFIVDGCEAFSEDLWNEIKINDFIFRGGELCYRCKVVIESIFNFHDQHLSFCNIILTHFDLCIVASGTLKCQKILSCRNFIKFNFLILSPATAGNRTKKSNFAKL